MLEMDSSVCKAKTRLIARFNLSSVLRKRRLSRECEAHFVLGSVRPFFAFLFLYIFPIQSTVQNPAHMAHDHFIQNCPNLEVTKKSFSEWAPTSHGSYTVLKRSEQATKRPGRALDLVVRDWGAGRDG